MYLSAISGFLYSNILPFIILLGILIFVHELGHFLVARMCGVRVEVFSLGFGKKIFSMVRGDTNYCISLIPLGGYVKMFGEQGSEAVLTEEDRKVSYSHKTPWQRIAIVLAGPLMNFFFAIFVFSLVTELGERTRAAVVADVAASSAAAKMGFKPGDKIIELNSAKIKSYEDFQKGLNQFKGSSTTALVEDENGKQKTLTLEITSSENPNIFSLESKLGHVEGILPYATSATVAVLPDSAAYKAGFRTGDEITDINEKKIVRWAQLNDLMLNSTEVLNVKLNRYVSEENPEKTIKTNLNIQLAAGSLSTAKNLAAFGFDSTELYLDQIMKDSPAAVASLVAASSSSEIATHICRFLSTCASHCCDEDNFACSVNNGLTKKFINPICDLGIIVVSRFMNIDTLSFMDFSLSPIKQ